jgi:hypothetical protein
MQKTRKNEGFLLRELGFEFLDCEKSRGQTNEREV